MFERAQPMVVGVAVVLGGAGASACDGAVKSTSAESKAVESKSAETKSAETKSTSKTPDRTCDTAYQQSLEDQLQAQCAIGEQLVSAEVPSVPWEGALASSRSTGAIELIVTTEGVIVNWGKPVSLSKMRVRLEEQRERSRTIRGVDPGWNLVIAGDVSRMDVSAVFDVLLESEMSTGIITLGTAPSSPIPKPRDPAVVARLAPMIDNNDLAQKATLIAKEIETNMPPCEGIENAFAAVAAAAAEQRCRLLAKGISEGLVQCGCPDDDELLTELYVMSVGTTPPERLAARIATTLDRSGPSAPGATWAEIVAGLESTSFGALWVAAG